MTLRTLTNTAWISRIYKNKKGEQSVLKMRTLKLILENIRRFRDLFWTVLLQRRKEARARRVKRRVSKPQRGETLSASKQHDRGRRRRKKRRMVLNSGRGQELLWHFRFGQEWKTTSVVEKQTQAPDSDFSLQKRLCVCGFLFSSSSSPLSGVCPSDCYDYESVVHSRRRLKAAWVGWRCTSSCPPLCHGRALSLCRQLLAPLLLLLLGRSPSCRRPSPEPSAAPSSPPPASCPPLPAPCGVSHAPSGALCGPGASAPPGGRTAEFRQNQTWNWDYWDYERETNLLLGEREPVNTRSSFGLQEQVVQEFGRRLVTFFCKSEKNEKLWLHFFPLLKTGTHYRIVSCSPVLWVVFRMILLRS